MEEFSAEESPEKVILRILKGMQAEMVGIRKASSEVSSELAAVQATLVSMQRADSKQDIKIEEIKSQISGCKARQDHRNVWFEIRRLRDFKDMIMSKAKEDSTVIDTHAQHVQQVAAEMAMDQGVPLRSALYKTWPLMILIFAAGLVLATLLAVQVLSGVQIIPERPNVEGGK